MANRLGIIAGSGALPRQLVDACIAGDRNFFVLGLEGHFEPDRYGDVEFDIVRLGALGRAVKMLHAQDVSEIVLAGGLERPSLASLRPDGKALKFLMRSKALSKGDDGLLSSIIGYLEANEGFRVVSAADILGDLGLSKGPLGRHSADDAARDDIERGRALLAALGPHDVGQAVVVQQGVVLGMEAIEGTAALLARCGELRRKGPGGVLIKMRKPGQEDRVDMPTIGPDTIRQAKEAGLAGIAIDAGGMILLDQAEMVASADRDGLFIEAVETLPHD